MPRLPAIGEQPYGPVFLEWLRKSHNEDGTLKGRGLLVADYGDGVGQGAAAVDTAAFQAAANASIASGAPLIVPPSLLFNAGISLVPSSGSRFRLNVESSGPESQILWAGPAGGSVFHSYGWDFSRIEGMNVVVPAGKDGTTVWDVDVDSGRNSSSYLSYRNCVTDLQAPGNAWRVGHSAGLTGGLDASFIGWDNCPVFGFTGGTTGKTGWAWEFSNALALGWKDTYGASLAKVYTNIPTPGAPGGALGGDTATWINCGGSANDVDRELKNAGTYTEIGGRWETGKKTLVVANGSTAMDITYVGTKWSGYAPSDNCVFDVANITYNGGRPVGLELHRCNAVGTNYTAPFITFQGVATRPAHLLVSGGSIQSAVDPVYTLIGSHPVDVDFLHVRQLDASLQPTGMFSSPSKVQVFTKAGAPVDADFASPQNGHLAIDTTNNRIYVRIGGAWKSVVVA